jgi:hypothetical protein
VSRSLHGCSLLWAWFTAVELLTLNVSFTSVGTLTPTNTIQDILPYANSSSQMFKIIYYFQNTIYFVVITLIYTNCCLKVLMLKYYNKEIMCWNYFGSYVILDSLFIWIYMIMVPAKAHKYIEINLYTQWMPTCFDQPCGHLQGCEI